MMNIGLRFASTAAKSHHKVLVVGAGSGGLNVANQIYNRFKKGGQSLGDGDVALVDGAEWHHYQPGWTLVGSGLKEKHDLRKPLASLIPSHIAHHQNHVTKFSPESNSVTTNSGQTLTYDTLVVAVGLQTNWSAIDGLEKALADPKSGVSSIYSWDTCDKAWRDIDSLREGRAIFTQPAGVIKCAGAPQKVMWMAWDNYQRTKRGEQIEIDFITGMPTMFSVKKYSDALNELRKSRGVGGKFEHNLVSIDTKAQKATFKTPDGKLVEESYSLLHVTPPMGPPSVVKNSSLADSVGWVDVDPGTLQHKNAAYSNIFALGDASSLPTSKTAAAITAQAPVLAENLYQVVILARLGRQPMMVTPHVPWLLTGYNQLMLAEFVYGLQPKESFGNSINPYYTSSIISLTYHGIKYPSPHTKGKLVEVFNNELKPRSAELLKEREARERKKPSNDGILDGHTGQAIQPSEPVPLRRSTRRSSRQPSESVPEPAHSTKRRRGSAEPMTTRSSSRNVHQPPAEPILLEESEQEEQAIPEEEPPRRSSRAKGPSLKTRRQSAGLSDANDSAWEDNNIFQSGAEDSPVKSARRQPKPRIGPPPVARRVSSRNSMSASPQPHPQNSRSPEQREVTPEPIITPEVYNNTPGTPAFIPRLPTTVSTPIGGLRTFNPPASQIRKSIAAAAPPLAQDEPSGDEKEEEEEEEEEEETQKPTNIADQSRGDELVEAAIDVEESDQDSLISDDAKEDNSYEQIDEPIDYNSAVAQRIASIGRDLAAGKALVQRADIKIPPVVPRWLSLVLGFGFSVLLSITASYKTESSSIGWCDTGSNTNSIIAERQTAQAARGRLIDSGEGGANKQEPHPLDIIPGLRAFASGLPGFGAVAFPPQCVEDDARKRKVSGVAKGMATYLETVKGERVCGGSIGSKPVDGGHPRNFGVKVNDLAELVLKEMKRSTNREDYHEIVETALNDLEKYGWIERSVDSKGDQWVASKRLSMGALCRVKVGARETWNEWQMHFYTLIATILGAFWTRSKLASKRRESRRIAELAAVALELVRNQEIAHHTDPVRSPHAYVSSLHLRDMVLQEEHNVHTRMRLWSKVAKIVEGNANIRANVEEVAGDETRVWRWVGASIFNARRNVFYGGVQ
ncbi:hypothetical protein RHS01_02816 [Rhizoctonia solani]|uniref:Sulfide:quinone oxidoreductase, mitochondrial n=1 Tax=Rhizoctonia solani TaxID=456999 RepID=A0A8H7IGZ9_9AGAM|nr:hypothetical protein RHS01_02816 [Rhizoctonia solani]